MANDQSDSSTIDPYDLLGFTRNQDGSITRLRVPPDAFPSTKIPHNPFLLVKDIPVNPSNNTWIRILIPRDAVRDDSKFTKLPVMIFFHGGGFVQYSAASNVFDDFYLKVVTGIRLIIISVEYRLAPENRLPAAYDDGFEALQWIKNISGDEECLKKYADLSRCFLMGSSAGANIALHVGMRCTRFDLVDLKPLEVKGLVLIQPFFGGQKRTQSELRPALDNETLMPLCVSDLLWELALPLGADRDHGFCNPMVRNEDQRENFDRVKALGWRVLVTGCYGDRLIDREIDFVKMLQENGVGVLGKFDEGGFHGIDKSESMIDAFCVVLKTFLKS